MEWTANRLIPTILVGGVVLGMLASTAVSTLPKAPPDPPWRLAAREAALKPSPYTSVGHGPIDLTPHLPWIGTGSDGSVAPLPEDLYRGRIIPIRSGYNTVIQEPLPAQAEPPDYALNEPDEPMGPSEESEPQVHPAIVDQPEAPMFAADRPTTELEDDSDLGG